MANDKWSGSNPWLGLAPYTEGTPLYGRTKESVQLADIIKDYTASVVFGKSGIGKSSLLSAGISPLLREENYIPVRIRLVHNTDVSYIEQIEGKVRETVKCIDSLPNDVNNLGLWDFFHRHSFTTENGINCIPVIILDQFEEIYTLTDVDHKKDIVTFFNELSSLLNDIKPGNVIEEEWKHSAVQNDSGSVTPKRGIIKRSAASALNYASATTFRFVICLREDKLYLLERNSANIPSLKANRYNLQALTSESALEVIMCPRPELFSNDEATAIINKLADMGDEGIRTVDPAILSLFLYKYYEKKGEANYDNIFADYYQEATQDIKGKSIAFLEDHLLTLGGYRNQVPLDDALSSGVTQEDIQSLLQSIIIRKEQRKGIDYIEFSHDRLCAEAKKNREDRTVREESKKAHRRMLVSALIFAVSAIMLSLVLWQGYKIKQEKARRLSAEVAADSIEKLNTANELQKDTLIKLNRKNLAQKQEIERQRDELLVKNEVQAKLIAKNGELQEELRLLANHDSISIQNVEAGKLAEMLPYNALVNVESLTISGCLNGSDIAYLRGAINNKHLKHLNLSDAKIISGGTAYYLEWETKDSVIGHSMFWEWESLETVILPQNTQSIESFAFYSCKNLRSITVPNSVTRIGGAAFEGCVHLTTIKIPNKVITIESTAFGYTGLTTVIIPNNVMSIENTAFERCYNLASVCIPNSVRSIGKKVFKGCSKLKEINSWIEDFNAVQFARYHDSDSYSQFDGISADCVWHVPIGCVEKYKSQPWWKTSWKIIDDLDPKMNK